MSISLILGMIFAFTVWTLMIILRVLSKHVYIPNNPFNHRYHVLLYKVPSEINTGEKCSQYMNAFTNPLGKELECIFKFYYAYLSPEDIEIRELLECATDTYSHRWCTYIFCNKVTKNFSSNEVQGVISKINNLIDSGYSVVFEYDN